VFGTRIVMREKSIETDIEEYLNRSKFQLEDCYSRSISRALVMTLSIAIPIVVCSIAISFGVGSCISFW
jgi:hypothetical protein